MAPLIEYWNEGSAKEQEQHGAVDLNLQAAWNRLHQRSVYLNSLVLLAGLCVLGLAHQS